MLKISNKNQGNTYTMIGVDFGSQSIKAVALSGRKGSFQVESCGEVATPKGAIVDYQIQNEDAVTKAVGQLLRTLGVRTKYVATSVSGSNVISKVVPIDATYDTDDAIADYIAREADQLVPFASEDVRLDFEVIGPNLNDSSKNDLLVCATRTANVYDRMNVIAANGYEAKVIDVSVHALARAACALVPGLSDNSSKCVALVDVGAVTMTFGVMVNGEVIYSRLQSFGGDNFTQNIAHFYHIPFEEAEKMKVQDRLPADAPTDVIPPHFSALTNQIKRNIQLFLSVAGSNAKIDMVVLTGGASQVPGLADHLATQLKKDVRNPDPFDTAPDLRSEFVKHGGKYMTALGLALRSFVPCQL